MSEPLTILPGDCREVLKTLPDESVQCVVTSPPYWGLRDYGQDNQIGLEKTPKAHVQTMLEVFREVFRILKDDGTLWLNLGDSYARNGGTQGAGNREMMHMEGKQKRMLKIPGGHGLKPKDLIGLPWMIAFALRDHGYYLRSDIIWHKPNPMPESVTDRPTKAHEYIFLLSKRERYYYDFEAVKEPVTGNAHVRGNGVNPKAKTLGFNSRIHQDRDPAHSMARKPRQNESFSAAVNGLVDARNKRSVWSVPTAPYRGGHFATFPPDLIKPCILAGCPVGGVVLDPFAGSGTTGMVARELGRRAILIELNPDYVAMARERTNVTPGLALATTS